MAPLSIASRGSSLLLVGLILLIISPSSIVERFFFLLVPSSFPPFVFCVLILVEMTSQEKMGSEGREETSTCPSVRPAVPPSVHPQKTGSENEDVSGSLSCSLARLHTSFPPSRLPLVACPSVRPLSVQCRNVAVTRAISVVVRRPSSSLSPFLPDVRGGAESGASHPVAGSEFLSLARSPARPSPVDAASVKVTD